MMRSARILVLAASLAAVSSIASGYAHWVFYAGRSAPFNGVPALFNLGSLTNNTVSYFISDQTPGGLMPGDSVASVISQIQGAAAVWNTVSSSNIRVAFGGYAAIGQPQTAPQSTPGIDVVFDDDDVPPGLAGPQRRVDGGQNDIGPRLAKCGRQRVAVHAASAVHRARTGEQNERSS